MLAGKDDLAAFFLIYFFSPGRIDRFDRDKITRLTDQIFFTGRAILDDHKAFEIHSKVCNPFLYCFFKAGIKPFKSDLVAAAILVCSFEFFLSRFDRALVYLHG